MHLIKKTSFLLGLGLCVVSARGADGAYKDDPREPTAFEAAVSAAGKDRDKLAAVESELLAAMQAPEATPAQMQAAAQQLGLVLLAGGDPAADSPTLRVLGPMLANPERVEYARLALDTVPGPAVDALYVEAMKNTTGPTRLQIIQSIGSRRIREAVPVLMPLLRDTAPTTAEITATALSQIGPVTSSIGPETTKHPRAAAMLNAILAGAANADAPTAIRVAEQTYRNKDLPLPQRAAALRLLISARPETAVTEIHAALSGTEEKFQQVAIEAVASLSAPGSAAQLAGRLSKYPAPVQTALIAALASLGDPAAVPAIAKVLTDKAATSEVRLAAIDALGRLPGTTEVAKQLAQIAAGSGAESRAASVSLARLNGPALDDFVRAGAASGDAKLRVVYIQQLAARNLTAETPFLLSLRGDAQSPVRIAALDALRDIASSEHQKPLVDWAVGTSDKNEQARAVRALIATILREDDVEARARTVVTALESGNAAARQVLLPILSRIEGAAAFAAATKLANDSDATVATTAVAELARWPDVSALPVLNELAAKTAAPNVRDAAVRGAAGFLARGEGVTREQRSAQARALLELPLGTAEKNSLLNVLSLCADTAALETAKRYVDHEDTASVARDAVDALTSNLAGPPDCTASNATADLPKISDGDVTTAWSVPNTPGEWLMADLKHPRPIRKITLDPGTGRGWSYPARVEIYVSDDPDQQGELRADVEGERGSTVVTLPAGVRGRYLWIRQTGTRDPAWTVAELLVE